NAFRVFFFVLLSMPPPKFCSAKPAGDHNPGAIFSVMKGRVKSPTFLENVMKFLSFGCYLNKKPSFETSVPALM
ncbi:MAG: hypothetical protein KAG70_16230, partial [Alcanivorax sp.]|nr:hypothetical protein [Alcanivorax sp.]